MSDALAIIPARANSKGVPGKNVRALVGVSPIDRAIRCAIEAGCLTYLSTDLSGNDWGVSVIRRPPDLAQDDTPMIDVVRHVLAAVPGPSEQIIVLLQPTQPLRTPAHVQAAMARLEAGDCDSVVSVVELPLTHSPDLVWQRVGDWVRPWPTKTIRRHDMTRRQDATPACIRDGTVYAFWRKTVSWYGTLYGDRCRALVIPASESCPLDDMEDWAEAERRLRDRA